jgi:hypothetical protein
MSTNFGDENVYSTQNSGWGQMLCVVRFQAPLSGTVDSVSVYLSNGAAATTVIGCVYNESGGIPGTLLCRSATETNIATSFSAQWVTLTLGAGNSITNGTYYHIGFAAKSTADNLVIYQSAVAAPLRSLQNAGAAYPAIVDPFGAASSSGTTQKMSMYATGTAAWSGLIVTRKLQG